MIAAMFCAGSKNEKRASEHWQTESSVRFGYAERFRA